VLEPRVVAQQLAVDGKVVRVCILKHLGTQDRDGGSWFSDGVVERQVMEEVRRKRRRGRYNVSTVA
jgi:hypothetical protein